MKNIAISALKPNSYFEKPVYIDKGYIILSPEVPVSIELIRRLNDWNYDKLFSDSDSATTTAPGLQHSVVPNQGILDKSITETKIEEEMTAFYNNQISFLEDFTKNFYEIGEIDMELLTTKVKEIIEVLKNNKNKLIAIIMQKKAYENYLYSHCINTAIISLSIGDILKFAPHKLIEIGIAAILHEIGMFKLPPKLYLSNAALSPQDKKTITAHTIIGYKILKNLSINDDLAVCAMEHHERADGSGYPRGMRGNAISLYAKIIAIACSFDGAVSARPYKKSLDGHKAMIDLLVTRKMQYDEIVLKALIYSLSIFPPGTYIQLNDNTRGVVTRTNPANPKYPVVRVLVNEAGEKISPPREVETSVEKGITIKHVLSEEEIQKYQLNT